MRWREKILRVETHNVDSLVHLFKDFQAGKQRFMIAFRHPSPQDAFCLAHLLWYDVPRQARELGITLERPIHTHFIYDRGIPLWAGSWVGWLYARLGGTPIQRGKVDRQGLRSARQLFTQGRWPMAAAPEGGNNGHTELVSPLEPGVAQLSFWCVEDLQKAGRPEQVTLLPLGIAYKYRTPPWAQLDRWLERLEVDSGLNVDRLPANHLAPSLPTATELEPNWETDPAMQRRYQRLLSLGEHLLSVMEAYYHRVYQMPLPAARTDQSGAIDTNLGERLETLRNAALQVAETYFQLPPKGTAIDRCRRIEQAGWERIFRQDLASNQPVSAVAQGLADREAEEADLRMWHMRLVENFVAVTGQYVRQRPTAERFAETLLILRDIVCLIKGENPFPRPKLSPQVAVVTVGEPISVSDRWPDYQANRKQAITQLTADLQTALEAMI
jgi:1-acyl-sn-glycerol-3-phosphate acyltransferase